MLQDLEHNRVHCQPRQLLRLEGKLLHFLARGAEEISGIGYLVHSFVYNIMTHDMRYIIIFFVDIGGIDC